jgi:hypothetical protein
MDISGVAAVAEGSFADSWYWFLQQEQSQQIKTRTLL